MPTIERHILMIGRGEALFTGLAADAITRHEAYAQAAGVHLWMIVITGAGQHKAIMTRDFSALPTNSRSPICFVRDAVRMGFDVASHHKINLIICQDPFFCGLAGAKLKKKLGAKLQIQDHGCFFSSPVFAKERLGRRLQLFLAKKPLRMANSIRVVNGLEAKAIKAIGKTVEPVIQPIPIDLSLFEPRLGDDTKAAIREDIGMKAHRPTLIWVGRDSPEKNLPLFLTAFAWLRQAHPEYQAFLVGPEGESIDGLSYLGHQPYEHLPALYQSASALINTSHYEGYGRIFIEAIASGIPVLATPTAGFKQAVSASLGAELPLEAAAMATAIHSFFLQHEPENFTTEAASYIDNYPTYEQALSVIVQEWLNLMDDDITLKETITESNQTP